MQIQSVDRPSSSTCLCGSVMVPAKRYEVTQTIDVWWCLDGCGREIPPMPTGPTPLISSWCRYCGGPFTLTDPRERYCQDDCRRRADTITLDRRHTGQQIRRRAI